MARTRFAFCTLALALVATGVRAADDAKPRELLKPPKETIASPITDRFALRGSVQRASVSTTVRYDTASGAPGTTLSAEDDLGLSSRQTKADLEMMFRMRERNRIRADFFQVRRDGASTLNRTVQFGGDTYQVSDQAITTTDIRFFGLTYTYSFLKAERFEFAAGLGLHLFQAEGQVSVPARRLQQNFDAAGPFPTLAVDGTYRITRRVSANARAQYFGIGIDNVDGSLGIYHADVQYRAWRNLAFGLGYTKTALHVDSTDSSFSGRLFLDVKGPEAFFRMSF